MAEAIPQQHPAVVLRSHYRHVRALLATAMVAIVALAATVVILATDDDGARVSRTVAPATQATGTGPAGGVRYDGGPEEGTRGIVTSPPADTRYDGGPDEGTRGPSR